MQKYIFSLRFHFKQYLNYQKTALKTELLKLLVNDKILKL